MVSSLHASFLVAASAVNVHDQARAELAARVNAIPGITWTAGPVERFAGTPLGSFKDMLGVKEDQDAAWEQAIAAGEVEVVNEASSNFEAPASFDSAENWPQCAKTILDIRDQSNCGCCWAFGAASAASDRLCIATDAQILVPLSANDMCFCSNTNGCGGGYVNAAWDYIKKSGLVTGGQRQDDLKDHKTDPFEGENFCSAFPLPHCHHHGSNTDPYPDETTSACPTQSSGKCPTKCDADAKAEHATFMSDKHVFLGRVQQYNGEATMQQALMEAGPIEVAFTVYDDFEVYNSGIYKKTSSQQMGGHAVELVGWGEEGGVKYWKVKNSWNPYWGENGYFRIVRGNNECGIESGTGANDPSGGWCRVESHSCAGQSVGSACATCNGAVYGKCADDGSCCSPDQLCGTTCMKGGDDPFSQDKQMCCNGKVKKVSFFESCCASDSECRQGDKTCCDNVCCGPFDHCSSGTCVSHFSEVV
jgi:cathepsin B